MHEVEVGTGRTGNAGANQRPIEPCRASEITAVTESHRLGAGKDRVGDQKRRRVRVRRRRRAIRHAHDRGRGRTSEDDPPFSALRRFDGDDLRRQFAGGHSAECRLDPLEYLLSVEISAGRNDGVVRRVIVLVVTVELIPGDAPEIAFEPDDRMAIRMVMERGAHHFLMQEIAGTVLASLAFRENHRALGFGFFRVEERIDHPVRFDLDRKIEPISREGFEIGGPVVRGERVQGAAVPADLAEYRALGEVRRALELHMFNPVGDAGLSR